MKNQIQILFRRDPLKKFYKKSVYSKEDKEEFFNVCKSYLEERCKMYGMTLTRFENRGKDDEAWVAWIDKYEIRTSVICPDPSRHPSLWHKSIKIWPDYAGRGWYVELSDVAKRFSEWADEQHETNLRLS